MVIITALLLYSLFSLKRSEAELRMLKSLSAQLCLTDLSVWTEARYTRHPSQADWFSPFQDFPCSVEHFPAGSLISPPNRRERG
ncbi:MAG: hypothetical protein D6710_07250 [Nitrospirae bacterium]|nr:MAG: hypothetical protein D6710_07250 [Nitrospirota bacterium]